MANRYWVGGSDIWGDVVGTKWATTSGGAGGASIPTSADDVFFDAASGAVTVTIFSTNFGAKSVTCTGFTGTLAGTGTLSVSGSVTLVAGMTLTYTGVLSIIATGTITSAGKTFGPVTVNGAGITVTLGGALTLGIANTFALAAGALDLNGFTLSAGAFSSNNSNTRAITFGSSNIALTSTTAATTVLSMATATNFTYTGTGGFTRVQAATATVTFGTTGGTVSNAPNLTVSAGAETLTGGASWFKNINFTGSTCTVTASFNIAGNLTLASGGTYTGVAPTFVGSSTVTSAGKAFSNVTVNGAGITVTLADAFAVGTGNNFTLTQGAVDLNGFTLSAGNFQSTNTNTRSIAFGSSNIALTSTTAATTVLAMNTATNFTYTGTGGFTRVQAATATVTFGPTGATSTNAPNLSVTSGASALTISTNTSFKALTLTGSTCTASGSVNIYGVLTLASGGTYTSLIPTFFATQTFNSLGKTLGGVTVNSSGITITLGDALTVVTTGVATLVRGTIDLNGFTLSAGSFSASTTNARSIVFGSANIALTSTTAAATVLSMADATNFTYTGTGGFTRNMAATATMVFGTTGGSVSNAPNLAVNAGVNGLTITANSWFKNFNFTGTTGSITSTNVNIAGDITIPLAVNVGPCSITFRASGTATTNIKSFANITLNAPGGVITCADGLSANTALTLVDGTLKLKNGATSDFGSIVTTGTTLKYLESSTAGSQATITDPTGTNTVTYLSIKDSNATGGAIFDATDPTNIDAGNNTGWLLPAAISTGNFFLLF